MTDEQTEQGEGFEAILSELEQVVRRLEQGEQSLERSLEDFERGVALAGKADGILDKAETRVEQLLQDRDGVEREESFEVPF
ncbi:MAG: exodeoxyribonuclease VII small subunit [Myxococcota bacterium]|nr:exodeoxyribonuclease VII small subunit [Myxococcota bacterium]